MSQVLFNAIQSHLVNDSVPSRKMKQVYSLLKSQFPLEMSRYAKYTHSDALYMLQHSLTKFRECKICGKELQRIPHRLGQQYCGMQCYKADPAGAAKISAIKLSLYCDPIWKKQTELKKIATNVKRSRYEHPMQDPVSFDLQQKMSRQSYEYRGISGLRGYEKYAVDRLLAQGVVLSDIVTGTTYMAESGLHFKYTTQAGKIRHYMPHLFVRGTNKFIEVKSEFTLDKGEEDNELFYKAKSITAMGHNLLIWVFDTKGNLVIDAEVCQIPK